MRYLLLHSWSLANILALPKAEIAQIFANKFQPENFYKLRHLKGREDKDRDENITIENGLMKLKHITGTLQDFGSI